MAHAAPTTRARAGHPTIPAGIWVPVVLGIVYGFWTSGNARDGGDVTPGNILLGFVSGIVFAGLWYALHRAHAHLPRELRAAAWAAFGGIALGFLVSLSGKTVLYSVYLGLAVAAGVFVTMFYRYYTTED
ncbi:hypothetical protein ACWCP6_30215 [Streptomyces sp. NPDC002004]